MPSTCWASTSSAPSTERRRVLRADVVGLERGAAFQHLEAVGRDQDRLGRLVHAVVGAADALRKPAGALRRADMDDEIDVAPVDAEVERRGGDDGAQAVRLHRLLDAAALADIERAVMQRDRQRILVDAPEFLEQQLRLAAGVDEEQRRLVALRPLRRSPEWRSATSGRPTARARAESRTEMSGLAPPATVIRSAMSPGGFWPTSQRRSSSGSATVADRPIACRPGTKLRSRASPSDSRWPRLEVTSECNSSSTT